MHSNSSKQAAVKRKECGKELDSSRRWAGGLLGDCNAAKQCGTTQKTKSRKRKGKKKGKINATSVAFSVWLGKNYITTMWINCDFHEAAPAPFPTIPNVTPTPPFCSPHAAFKWQLQGLQSLNGVSV